MEVIEHLEKVEGPFHGAEDPFGLREDGFHLHEEILVAFFVGAEHLEQDLKEMLLVL